MLWKPVLHGKHQIKLPDTQACLNTWQYALQLLNSPDYDLVVLDELTYMISFHYLPLEDVVCGYYFSS